MIRERKAKKVFYLMANKPGKHLATRIHAKPSIILKDKVSNALIRNNKVINDTLKSFYGNIYKSEIKELLDPSAFLDTVESNPKYVREK